MKGAVVMIDNRISFNTAWRMAEKCEVISMCRLINREVAHLAFLGYDTRRRLYLVIAPYKAVDGEE